MLSYKYVGCISIDHGMRCFRVCHTVALLHIASCVSQWFVINAVGARVSRVRLVVPRSRVQCVPCRISCFAKGPGLLWYYQTRALSTGITRRQNTNLGSEGKDHDRFLPDVKSFNLYDSNSRLTCPFIPKSRGCVHLYTCGPTAHAQPHIGNLRSFVVQDVLKRWMTLLGYNVKHVCNITDTGEQIDAKASRSQTTTGSITSPIIETLFQTLEKLKIVPAQSYPRSSECVGDSIALVQFLLRGGWAYVCASDGSIYFDATRNGAVQNSGNTEVWNSAPVRKARNDFVIWKLPQKPSASDQHNSWPSPWGNGRPGWHTECAVMILKEFGPYVDIQAGGVDLKFPHHHNTLLQLEAVRDLCSKVAMDSINGRYITGIFPKLFETFEELQESTTTASHTTNCCGEYAKQVTVVRWCFHHAMVESQRNRLPDAHDQPSARPSEPPIALKGRVIRPEHWFWDKISKSRGTSGTVLNHTYDSAPNWRITRLCLIANHYRKPLRIIETKIINSRHSLRIMDQAYYYLHKYLITPSIRSRASSLLFGKGSQIPYRVSEWRCASTDWIRVWRNFADAMNDDLDTTRALAVLHNLCVRVNRILGPTPWSRDDLSESDLAATDETILSLLSACSVFYYIDDALGLWGKREQMTMELSRPRDFGADYSGRVCPPMPTGVPLHTRLNWILVDKPASIKDFISMEDSLYKPEIIVDSSATYDTLVTDHPELKCDILAILIERQKSRSRGDFVHADALRDKLKRENYGIRDLSAHLAALYPLQPAIPPQL